MINLEKRLDENSYVDRPTYYNGLMHICRLLITDLNDLLEKENRKFGIVIKYLQKIDFAILFIPEPNKEINLYGKIIYLFKPAILFEFKKLIKKRVTKADAVITILYRILEFIIKSDTENDYKYLKYTKKIFSIIENLYNNIKNNGKKTNLTCLINSINQYLDEGLIGQESLESLNLLNILNNTNKEDKLEGNLTKIDESSAITEISF